MSSTGAETELVDHCSRLERALQTTYGFSLSELSPEALSKLEDLVDVFDHYQVSRYGDTATLMTKWLAEEAYKDKICEVAAQVKRENIELSQALQSASALSRQVSEHIQDINEEYRLHRGGDEENEGEKSNWALLRAKNERLKMKSLEYIEKKKHLLEFNRKHKDQLEDHSHSSLVAKYKSIKEVSGKLEEACKERKRYGDLSHDLTTANKQLSEAKTRLLDLQRGFENKIASLDM